MAIHQKQEPDSQRGELEDTHQEAINKYGLSFKKAAVFL